MSLSGGYFSYPENLSWGDSIFLKGPLHDMLELANDSNPWAEIE